jgi:hypothetical protein
MIDIITNAAIHVSNVVGIAKLNNVLIDQIAAIGPRIIIAMPNAIAKSPRKDFILIP